MSWLPEPVFDVEVTEWDLHQEAERFARLAEAAIRSGGAPLDTDL